MDSMTTYAACERIRTEYIEMPDLKLTVAQVRRLCGLRAEVCEAAVRVLIANGFLYRAANGALLRARRDTVLFGEPLPSVRAS